MKKTGRWLASLLGTVLGLFSGCSGGTSALYMGPPPEVAGTVTDKNSSDPIAALRVELLRVDTPVGETTTLSNGDFHFTLVSGQEGTNYTIRITDIDGTNNGAYHGLTNTVFVSHSFYTNYELEPK